jgi:NADH:ubiquinone oxidoreductase subunit
MVSLKNFFTWWEGATVGTALFSWRNGVKVGSDSLGNLYFQTRNGDRRWVIYNGSNDASRIPPEWYSWIHRQIDGTPDEALPPRSSGAASARRQAATMKPGRPNRR